MEFLDWGLEQWTQTVEFEINLLLSFLDDWEESGGWKEVVDFIRDFNFEWEGESNETAGVDGGLPQWIQTESGWGLRYAESKNLWIEK